MPTNPFLYWGIWWLGTTVVYIAFLALLVARQGRLEARRGYRAQLDPVGIMLIYFAFIALAIVLERIFA